MLTKMNTISKIDEYLRRGQVTYRYTKSDNGITIKQFYNDIFDNNKLNTTSLMKYSKKVKKISSTISKVKISDVHSFCKNNDINFELEIIPIDFKLVIVMWWEDDNIFEKVMNYCKKNNIVVFDIKSSHKQVGLMAFYSHFVNLLFTERFFVDTYKPRFDMKIFYDFLKKKDLYLVGETNRHVIY
jgi:hypothetical protein